MREVKEFIEMMEERAYVNKECIDYNNTTNRKFAAAMYQSFFDSPQYQALKTLVDKPVSKMEITDQMVEKFIITLLIKNDEEKIESWKKLSEDEEFDIGGTTKSCLQNDIRDGLEAVFGRQDSHIPLERPLKEPEEKKTTEERRTEDYAKIRLGYTRIGTGYVRAMETGGGISVEVVYASSKDRDKSLRETFLLPKWEEEKQVDCHHPNVERFIDGGVRCLECYHYWVAEKQAVKECDQLGWIEW